jgi:uncharacterized coiled-coil DUF342 family protein
MSGANSIILGNVSFGPARSLWEEQPTLRELYDQACASIVRAECEIEELRAEVAMKHEQARIIAEERDEARIQYRSTEALGMALVKTINEMKAERAELQAEVQSYRADACRESCHDKAAADGGWANI